MAEVIHTHDSVHDDYSGPSAAVVVIALLIAAFLVLGAWWLFWSSASPIRDGDTTVITPSQQVAPAPEQQAAPPAEGDTNIQQTNPEIVVPSPGTEATTP